MTRPTLTRARSKAERKARKKAGVSTSELAFYRMQFSTDNLIEHGWNLYRQRYTYPPRAGHMARVFVLLCLLVCALGIMSEVRGCS
jgi:hypothetical protein